ncbi:MAG: arsenate reductase family protein [Selenomonadaceae bacterium]|jgi:arsenate reductase
MNQLILYPKCTTCQRAKKWLDEQGISYSERHIKEQNPTAVELEEWHSRSGLPLKRFFNTSGQLYKMLQLKDKLPGMSESEQFALLASDGMLVRRPLFISEEQVLVGFKPEIWAGIK